MGKIQWVLTDYHQNVILMQILQRHRRMALSRPMLRASANDCKLHNQICLPERELDSIPVALGQCAMKAGKQWTSWPPIFHLPNSNKTRRHDFCVTRSTSRRRKQTEVKIQKQGVENEGLELKRGYIKRRGKMQNQEDRIKIYYLRPPAKMEVQVDTLCLLAQPKEGQQQFKNKNQPELMEN